MNLFYLEEIDSTNKYAKEHIQNLSDKTVVYTFNQTNGRGRLERKWSYLGKDNILNTSFEFFSLKDENGFPLQGTGKILSRAEKEKVIDYLDHYCIPFYDVVVDLAMRLYANHSLELNQALQQR